MTSIEGPSRASSSPGQVSVEAEAARGTGVEQRRAHVTGEPLRWAIP
jgi:hypothetical protein